MRSLVVVFLFFIYQLQAQTGSEIIAKADEKSRGNSSTTEVTIQIIRPSWTREMKMKSWSQGTELSMSVVLSPAKDRGTVFLKRNRELWNWVPSIERTIKMPPSMLTQSWMGSDLTNDDLVKETSNKDDFNCKILGTETMGGRACWKIEMLPKAGSAVVWGKVLTWVDQKDFVYMKSEFYDEDNYLVNTMLASEIKNMGGRNIASKTEVIPAEHPGNKTVMILNSANFNANNPTSFFTVQNMRKVK